MREFDRWSDQPQTCHAKIDGRRCGMHAQRTCPGCDLALCSTCSHMHTCEDCDAQVALSDAIRHGGDELIHRATHGVSRAEMIAELEQRHRFRQLDRRGEK